ncbi:hypothetical protein SAMN04487766_12318 [Actinomyces ruminicola]|uniref:Uncharacterized protein n=2 Tax=Actinomyces ruminicola TaxID=332524 RepID=A0A1H0AAY9_9ACTO|nr:hypothetical protein SAMN04487766_12318 [Actinomyces ruminicola]
MDAIIASTDSDAVKSILADHVITESELVGVQDAMRTCLEPSGITEISFSTTEISYETNTPDGAGEELTQAMSECEVETGFNEITYLYQSIHKNPAHEDLTQSVVDCMIAKDLVESDYSVSDYNRDAASGNLPGTDTDDGILALSECQELAG